MAKRSTTAKRVLLALEWYDHRIHRGVARVAAREGWHLTCTAGLPLPGPVPPGWRGDGAISLLPDGLSWRRLRRACPLVVDVGLGPSADIPRTVVDNRAIAELAARHFHERGYRHAACITIDGIPMFAERSAAFTEAAARLGMACHRIDLPPDRSGAAWWRRVRALGRRLSTLPRPLAVFAVQDSLGVEAVLGAREADLAVPQEAAVLGVDDVELVCDTLVVPLSSVDSDQEGLGHAAAERLAGLFAGRSDDGALHRWAPRGITVRASTEAVGATHPGIARALDLARRRPECGLTALARAAGLSAQGLDKAFRRELGETPGKVLRRLRLERAQRALAGGATLAVAAEAAGLATASGLCALLRRELGITPARWRERALASINPPRVHRGARSR